MNKDKIRKELIGYYFSLKSITEKFNMITPFCIILAFVVAIPRIKAVEFRWLFALCTLFIAVDICVNRLEEAFKNDITITRKIKDSKTLVEEIDKNIKKLEEKKEDLIKLKQEVKK